MFSLHPLNGMPFSTRDRENDLHSRVHCAVNYVGNAGGWWYAACSYIHLSTMNIKTGMGCILIIRGRH